MEKAGREGMKDGACTTRFCYFNGARGDIRAAPIFRHVMLCCGRMGVRQ